METWLRDSSLFSFSLNEKRVFLVCTSFLHQANEQENALAFIKYHLNYVPPPASMTSEMWYEVDVQHPPPSLDLSLLSRLCLEIQNPYELETLLRSSLTFCMPDCVHGLVLEANVSQTMTEFQTPVVTVKLY